MQPQRRTAVHLLLAGALTAGAACTEQTAPTAVPVDANAALAPTAAPNPNTRFKIKTFQLSANTLRIDGPSATASVSIGNSGPAVQSGISLRAEIIQGQTSRQAASLPTQCSPGDLPGFLSQGTCEMTFSATASNSAPGNGTLVAGAATFMLHVIQTSGGVEAELANKSILVNLVATPIMTVTLAPTTLTIGGAAATATAVIQNPANSLQGVLLQGWIVQGVAPNQTRHASGGTLVACGSNAGVLPPGACTMTVLASATNPPGIPGTLVAGPATFELQLMQSNGGSSTTYDVKTVAITLVPQNAPRITGVEIPFSITLGSASSYKAFIQNDGPSVSTVKLKNFFIQGATRREAFGRTVQCGAAPVGEVPTGGPCIVVAGFAADNTLPGSGTLVPGPATLEIDLDLQTSAGTVTLQKQFIEIILVQAMATMTLTPPTTDVVINTPVELVARYGVSIANPGLPLSTVTLQAEIKQGTTARAAGGANVTCGGTPLSGVLPDGTCTETRPISSFNQNGGSGTLVPGPAILEVSLLWFNGTTTTLLDKKTADITLVAGVSITDLTLPLTDILPGAEYSYTVTINNPFSTTLANARIDAYVDQGSIVGSAAGGTPLTCTQTWGELAPGTCTISYTFTVPTAPAWQLGNATFRLRLKQGNAIWDEKTFPIKIVGLQ